MTESDRDIIQRLADALEEYDSADPFHDCNDIVAEARSFLAQQQGPTDEELAELASRMSRDFANYQGGLPVNFARAVLARWGNTPPQPVPVAELRALLRDDAFAATFQSLGQYRSALLNRLPSHD